MTTHRDTWQATSSGELCEFITSGSRDWRSYYSDSGPLFIRTQDINQDRLDLSEVAHVSLPDKVEGKRSRVQPGDLLVTITGANVGRVALVPKGIPEAYVSQSVGLMRLKDKRMGPYFHYYLQSDRSGRKHVLDMVYGIGRPVLSLKNLREIPVTLPPLDEQQRIVAEIEKQFTRLDTGVGSLKRVQTALKRYRAGILKAACEGRLVSTEAELARKENRSYETGEQLLQRILNVRRKKWNGKGKYKEPASIEPGTPPMIAEGWALASAEAVCSSVRDGTHDTPAYVAQGMPLITSKNLLPTGLDFENVKFISQEDHAEIGKRSGVQRGDILFAMIGTIGNPVVVETDREFSIKNVGLFKANPGFILSRYLQYWFTSPQFIRWLGPKQKGTTQKFVPLALLRSLVVSLPPLAEQTRIVAEVEAKLSIVDELEMMATSQFRRVTRLRQSILQQAFEGKLTGKNNILD